MSDETAYPHLRALLDAGADRVGDMHFVTLGGCITQGPLPSQDRFHGEMWDLPGGKWKFSMVLDGHGEQDDTVDFALAELPRAVERALAAEFAAGNPLGNEQIAALLTRTIVALDERIKNDFLALLPADLAGFDASKELRYADGNTRVEVRRCANGTTVCIALVDPTGGVHVVNVGDCDSFLCWTSGPDDVWETLDLAPHHRTSNPAEIARIRSEHPDEPDCVTADERLLTLRGMNLSRAIGDVHYKFPNAILEVIALATSPNYALYLRSYNKTPPYMSHVPEVFHAQRPAGVPPGGHCFLIQSSDGLDSLIAGRATAYQGRLVPGAMARVAAAAGRARDEEGNMARAVIWESFASEVVGLNLYELADTGKWGGRRDDITVAVVPV
ncbi:Serine/threonine protein phosphatase 2C [Mycena indigotica]|uniref:Serine/threonine protein phosphatase 2C n=1 Tax=Mycena indigotica TaxID=2126181 RepID=A0A8H6W0F1_9AGAR|nr:Serine/threonine protein phosphatase 2C [Mycena indigotica]KAF7297018.1 Serine/threonine protein phosphatase 2C [Mycena indigotica]